ncbi:MAG: HEAT repeat domain-containing protein [Bdellovibrionia bacterium]
MLEKKESGMWRTNKGWILIFSVFFLASVGLLLPILKTNPVDLEKQRLENLFEQDRKILKKKDATESQVYAALVRLAKVHDPLALEYAMERKATASSFLKKALAEVFGFFDTPETHQGLLDLSRDSNLDVRLAVVSSLTHSQLPKREELLGRLLENESAQPVERITILATLIQVTSSAELRKKTIEQLLSVMSTHGEIEVPRSTLILVVNSAAVSPEIQEFLKKILDQRKFPALGGLAVRQLAALRNPWLKSKAQDLSKSPDSQVRLALVESLHWICPKDLWRLIGDLLVNEKDRDVQSALLDELQLLVSRSSIPEVERILKNANLEHSVQQRLKAWVNQALRKQTVQPAFCASGS